MAVIGTAGHVDHGKSTLIAALTGRDPDRWKEEKERGLTIDLGFAWATLGDTEVSFVDVPGHERFIKNMLAGSETVDAVLFVVAADEGWMPQSEEHLGVVDSLGVTKGVVALTKLDAVDNDLAELAQLEIEEKLAGTALEGMPIVGVSAVTGTGLPQLKEHLEAMAQNIDSNRTYDRPPKLWIDRSFSVSGAGTVVTGTLSTGVLHVGDSVELWPSGDVARIRTLHRHDREVESIKAGSRCAVNLSGTDRTEVGRGSLLTSPGNVRPTAIFLAETNVARYVDELTQKGAYHLHLGSGAWPADLRSVPGIGMSPGMAVIKVSTPLPVTVGDRFILREVGRQSVVGGGIVSVPGTDPRPSRNQFFLELAQGNHMRTPDDLATDLLSIYSTINDGSVSMSDLQVWSNGGSPSDALISGDIGMPWALAEKISTRITSLVRQFHTDNPLREGYPKASLASKLGVELSIVETIIAADKTLRDDGTTAALASFNAKLTPDQEIRWVALQKELETAGLAVPRIADLELDKEMLHVLLREGRVTRISEDFVYLPDQVAQVTEGLSNLPEAFTVAEFRDAFGLSRKYAVPFLEYLDGQGITSRNGDTRTVR